MPDLRQTRKNIKTSLAILLGVDVVALGVLFSPLVGSTESRRQELNQLWSELQTKTRQVEPLANLPDKVRTANKQIADFYKKGLDSNGWKTESTMTTAQMTMFTATKDNRQVLLQISDNGGKRGVMQVISDKQ